MPKPIDDIETHQKIAPTLLASSDKSFWHGYLDFYEQLLPRRIQGQIVEFGVFMGHSIRWLMANHPDAKIIGVDILATRPDWPVSERVQYRQLDQGSPAQVAAFFDALAPSSLIIEDGSHVPSHQSRCLKHGMNNLAPGGIYILEDIQTSHPKHSSFKEQGIDMPQTSLSVLLALEQIKRTGRNVLTDAELDMLSQGQHFSRDEVLQLNAQIASIHVFKRATLPTACYACGSTTFNFHQYKCLCGISLMGEADSMSIVCKRVPSIIRSESTFSEYEPSFLCERFRKPSDVEC